MVLQNRLNLVLITAALFFTSSAFANRPAMEETNQHGSKTIASPEETPSLTPPEPLKSSVELMMQQQSQQSRQAGDVVQLPAKEMQPGESIKIQLLDFPRRGMSMDRVQAAYGRPIAISESVGKPPITRWTYDDRVVFFEYSTVIHVVAR